MQNYMTALVIGDGKEYSIHFPANRLERVQQKYTSRGATLKVSTAVKLQEAPPTRAKKMLGKHEYETSKPLPAYTPRSGKASDKTTPAEKPKPVTSAKSVKAVAKAKPVAPVKAKAVKVTTEKPEKPAQKVAAVAKAKVEPAIKYGWGKNPGSRNNKAKATINLTTGEFFEAIQDAATAVGGYRAGVHSQMNGTIQTYRGCKFRYATKKEIKAKRMLL